MARETFAEGVADERGAVGDLARALGRFHVKVCLGKEREPEAESSFLGRVTQYRSEHQVEPDERAHFNLTIQLRGQP